MKTHPVRSTKILVGLLVASASLTPALTADASPRGEDDPKLIALRDELHALKEAQALSKRVHFRPLCDKDGYPLVGNVVGKGPSGYQPSAFCAVVRKGSS